MALSNFLKIPLLSVSQVAKEQTINSMVQYLERAMNDSVTLNFAGGNLTLPETDFYRYQYFKVTNAGGSSLFTIPKAKRMFTVDNLSNGFPLSLYCTSDTLEIPANGIVLVLCDGFNLISVADSTIQGAGSGGVTTFTGLNDVPGNYTGSGSFLVRVKADASGIEFIPATTELLTDMLFTDLQDGDVIAWAAADSKFKNVAGSGIGGGGGATGSSWRTFAHTATLGPVSIADDLVTGALIDTTTLQEGTRILVWKQTAQNENGIYVINSGGTAERAGDANTVASLQMGTTTIVLSGTYARQLFMQVNELALMGTSSVVFEKQSAGAVGDLVNVDLSGLSDGKFLKWDESLQKFVPGTFTASGLPTGGTTRQVLAKASNDDGDFTFIDGLPDPTGSANKIVAVKASGDGYELVDKPTGGGSEDPGIPGAPSSTKWRIWFTANGGNGRVGVSEVEFRATPNGADQAVGGVANVSSSFTGVGATAFDGNLSNRWIAQGVDGQWISYDFPEAVQVSEVMIASTDEPDYAVVCAPKDFRIEYYDTALSAWTLWWQVTGAVYTTYSQPKVFTHPGADPTNPLGLSLFVAGKPASNELLFRMPMTRVFDTRDMSNSLASARVASTGNVSFTIKQGSTTIGSVTFNASATGVFSGTGAKLALGEVLNIYAPAAADATLEDISIALLGKTY